MRNVHLRRIFCQYPEQLYKLHKDILEKFYEENGLKDVQIDTINVFLFAFLAGMGILRYASKQPFDYKRYSEEFRKKFFFLNK